MEKRNLGKMKMECGKTQNPGCEDKSDQNAATTLLKTQRRPVDQTLQADIQYVPYFKANLQVLLDHAILCAFILKIYFSDRCMRHFSCLHLVM